MKRKHSEMIKAWAGDDSLVCFVKTSHGWREIRYTDWDEKYEFFICLHQHNEHGQCLAWLNGKALVVDNGKGNGEAGYTLNVIDNPNAWTDFLRYEYKFRIKPEKEKRWIGVILNGGLTTKVYKTRDEVVNSFCSNVDYQVIEIEVEV